MTLFTKLADTKRPSSTSRVVWMIAHVVQVELERPPARRGEPVVGLGIRPSKYFPQVM